MIGSPSGSPWSPPGIIPPVRVGIRIRIKIRIGIGIKIVRVIILCLLPQINFFYLKNWEDILHFIYLSFTYLNKFSRKGNISSFTINQGV